MTLKNELAGQAAGMTEAIARRKAVLKAASAVEMSPDDRRAETVPGKMAEEQDRRWLVAKVTELTEALELERKETSVRELPVNELHEVPGRRRKLTPEQYSELKENISQNKILDLIRVRPRKEGGWEIISGNNKTSICRDLGIATVKCIVEVVGDAQADVDAFYANLYQTPLPDYEKYMGFKMMMAAEPNVKPADLARRTGKSEGEISELLSFEKLPAGCHSVLTERPHLLGHSAAAALARLSAKGMEVEVVDAVQQIASGLKQGAAVKLVRDALATKKRSHAAQPLKTSPAPLTIKAGRTKYCSLNRVAKVLRIEFGSTEEAETIEEMVREVLQKRADALKPQQSSSD